MKYILLLLLFTGFYSPTNKRYKNWNKDEKLSWKDFSFVNENSQSMRDAKVFVLIRFKYFYEPELKFSVVAAIDRDLSWTIDTISKDLLTHEQYHFDLCELYARQIRMKLDSLMKINCNDVSKGIDLFKRCSREHKSIQEKYDLETNHGMDSLEQNSWELYISKELNALNMYKDTLVPKLVPQLPHESSRVLFK